MSTRLIRAAGGLVWREGPAGVEVALVHRPRYDDWSLPKGKLDRGEHPLVAACREVAEESALRPVPGVRLPSVRYRVAGPGGAADKVVDFWSMAAGDGAGFTPNDEVDQLRWVRLDRAPAVLTDDDYLPVLAAFAALPRITATVLLVRHASAGRADEWDGADELRPLDDSGVATANRLATLLPLFAPVRLLTATPLRCVQTIEPSARRLRREPSTAPVFDEVRHDPLGAVQRVRRLADLGGASVVASQGGIIPATLDVLVHQDGVTLADPSTPKGAVWVLSFAADRLAAVDLLRP
ncbi:NUDIX hydrolase [Actinocatenispora thailandica]|uniref:NUDIX hydrolase n=1 Tax=Actinocatenispora thailandica TaxID=227318 RepID=A0A7R7DN33_9ACTN|nr:NUDIX hydrolase [Actinocatenispora thailandica]BCJ34725.1 NUDIX hydrolase [Actinocatenispora thailandica]